jgi:hypothetical protein
MRMVTALLTMGTLAGLTFGHTILRDISAALAALPF